MIENIVLYPNPAPTSAKTLWMVAHRHGDISDRLPVPASPEDVAGAKRLASETLGFDVVWEPRAGTAENVFLGTRAAS